MASFFHRLHGSHLYLATRRKKNSLLATKQDLGYVALIYHISVHILIAL